MVQVPNKNNKPYLNLKIIKVPPTDDKRVNVNYRKNIFHLVAFFALTAVFLRLLVEFRIHETLKIQTFRKTYKIKNHYMNHTNDLVVTTKDDLVTSNDFPFDLQSMENNSILREYSSEDETFELEMADFAPSSNTLLNISDFKWLRNNETLCAESEFSSGNNILPVLIHTSRDHFLERQAIRNTWGSLENYEGWTVRPVFLMGDASPTQNLAKAKDEEFQLDEEHHQYGDIITGNFIDSYRNLTYKHLMGYKWILEHCTNASYVMKTDDDMFIDIFHFIDMRVNETALGRVNFNNPQTNDIYCYEFRGAKPFRCKGCKWYVSVHEWPEETFPLYCSGWAYGTTVDWINRVYMMSYQTKYLWVDDVFIGILMNMAISFFREEPRIQRLNQLYTFDNKLYLEMCKNFTTGNDGAMRDISLANATRKFGAVVYVARGNNFLNLMECLWRKTLLDRKMI